MRAIKCRGQMIDTKEWVYGSLIQMDSESSQCFIYPYYNGASSLSCGNMVRLTMVPIERETIGQYTGLKDKNGVEIYERDIIKFGNQIGCIGEMQHGCYTFIRKEKYFKCDPLPFCSMNFEYVEVIGNVYENPELVAEVN